MSPRARMTWGRRGRVPIHAAGLAVVACLATAGPGAARQAGPDQVSELQRRLQGVSLVELHLVTGESVRGRPVGWVEDWLLLDTGRRVAAGEVSAAESLRRRTGKDARRGQLLGIILGAGLLVTADGAEGEARD